MFILGGIIDGDQSFSVEVRKASNDPRGRFEKDKNPSFQRWDSEQESWQAANDMPEVKSKNVTEMKTL